MYLTPENLTDRGITVDATRAATLIADVEARAVLVAPCLAEPDRLTDLQRAAVVAILADIVDRKVQSVTAGATTTQKQAGIYSESVTVSTEAVSKTLFWPGEIADLQDICAAVTGAVARSGAFSIALHPNIGTTTGGYRRGVYGAPNSPVTWGQ